MRSSKHTIIVDLSRGAIKLARAETAGEAVRFHDISRIDVAEDSGSSQEAGLITAAIGGEVRRHGWEGMQAACLLSGQATSTQSFLFPKMPKADLRRAIELKLRDNLHFDLGDATYDYSVVAKDDSEGRPQFLTHVAIAQRAAVSRAVDILTGAGLRPVAVGAAAESLANLSLSANLCKAHEVTVHVDIGAESAIVNLFEGSSLRFSREIDTASDAFLDALQRPILTANGAVHLTRAQAHGVLHVAGYPQDTEDLDLPHNIQVSDILPLMEPVAHRLSIEIGRSLDYLRGITGRPQVDRIVLSGSGGSMRRLDTWLQDSLDTPVSYQNPVERAMWHWRLAVCDRDPPELADFSAILGFSLGNCRPINLIPRESRLGKIGQGLSKTRKVFVPVSLAVGSCLAMSAIPTLRPRQASTTSLVKDSTILSNQLEEIALQRHSTTTLVEGLQEVLDVRGPLLPWRGMLLEIAAAMPADARLDSLSIGSEENTPTMRLEVRIREEDGNFEPILAGMTSRLDDSPFFGVVQVLDASIEQGTNEGVFVASLTVIGQRVDVAEPPR